MIRDALTPHLRQMKAMNAGVKRLQVGSRRRPVLSLVFKTVRGEVLMTNRLTGTTARASDAVARLALLAELGAWLEFVRLRLRWELAPRGPRRAAAGRRLVAHLDSMKAEKNRQEGQTPRER